MDDTAAPGLNVPVPRLEPLDDALTLEIPGYRRSARRTAPNGEPPRQRGRDDEPTPHTGRGPAAGGGATPRRTLAVAITLVVIVVALAWWMSR